MKIRNIEVDFDFLDADDMSKFEQEAQKVVDNSEKMKVEKMTMSEGIRKECEIIDDFFDFVFGQGTSKRIFNGKMNLAEHIKVFEEIANEKNKVQKDFENTLNRYQPNRQEKRNNKYKRNGRR